MTLCDQCGRPADITLTAAYPADSGEIHAHPRWHTYPAPMIRCCWQHLNVAVLADHEAPASTPGYLLRIVER